MTDQPTQDAKVSQRARDFACAYLSEMAGLYGNDAVKSIRDNHPTLLAFARFEAEIEAATIERCAERIEYLAADEYQRDLATDIRNLKGQTS